MALQQRSFAFAAVAALLALSIAVLSAHDQNSLDRRAVEFDFACNAFISVIFAIKQRNTDALASKLKAVSDPATEDCAKFVDGEPDAVNNVVTSLILRNVAYRMPAANNYVIVDKMPLAVASELFMCNKPTEAGNPPFVVCRGHSN
ncbi:hypothetical protein CAOG_08631 [Capsaspora owczarzaki ATCC 30864]|uniref:hypothetical protein n=1 Tax=Capsaspora owczarzaki (strain ATCC 30864) TaxID=595528 RepID=UPI0003520FFD|nr:hypothetical protein CAOG_08631 [Capsaspora owczarzaki ATCC 30864]|eukprot:XP_011270231.1 hypothetical protein CAOG_08631 [Capsaspora owczarzaki ATCC 30864]